MMPGLELYDETANFPREDRDRVVFLLAAAITSAFQQGRGGW